MRRLLASTVAAVVVACTGGPDTTSSSASSSSGSTSSSSSSGAATCVTVDEATYDKSCTRDSDCTILPMGKLCTGNCGCGGSTVNQNERTRWQTDTASVKLEACPCASPGQARCVQNACTLCTFADAAPGCPDAG